MRSAASTGRNSSALRSSGTTSGLSEVAGDTAAADLPALDASTANARDTVSDWTSPAETTARSLYFPGGSAPTDSVLLKVTLELSAGCLTASAVTRAADRSSRATSSL